jgi:hypothetical protein
MGKMNRPGKEQAGLNRDQVQGTGHPFVVRIWLEETADEARQAKWRGEITHLPSGKRSYVESLQDITGFIIPYLESMGVTINPRQRIRR